MGMEGLIAYSKNCTNPELKELRRSIESAYSYFAQLHWNALYMKDEVERDVLRYNLEDICENLKRVQTLSLRYRKHARKVITKLMRELKERYQCYLGYLVALGLMQPSDLEGRKNSQIRNTIGKNFNPEGEWY